MTNHDTTSANSWTYGCRSCGSRFDLGDLAQDGTCPWCGGRHLTAYEPPSLIGEEVDR